MNSSWNTSPISIEAAHAGTVVDARRWMTMMHYYGSYGWNGWMLAAMWVWPLVIAAAVWAVVALTRDRRSAPVRRHTQAPMEVLKLRFARGEISEEEYLQAAAILDNDSSRAARG